MSSSELAGCDRWVSSSKLALHADEKGDRVSVVRFAFSSLTLSWGVFAVAFHFSFVCLSCFSGSVAYVVGVIVVC